MSVQIEGLDRLLVKLDKITDENALKTTLGQACALVEKDAKSNAPKDTGALRRSITSKVEGEKGIVFTPLEYAPYIEYGTGLFAEKGGRQTPWKYQDDKGEWHSTQGMKPHPFLRTALENNRDEIKKIIKEGLLHD